MRLGSDSGARVNLRIVDYQFPDNRGDGSGKDWDANWLVIAGDAVAEDMRAWSFRDPCLTTWEARRLAEWLRGVIDGAVLPGPFDGSEAEHLLVFTEPNLAFSLADRPEDGAVIRVHLSLEIRPPWLTNPNDPDIFDYFVLVTMPVADLTLAVADWERMVATHPVR